MPACHLPALLAGLTLSNGVTLHPDPNAPPPPGGEIGRPDSVGHIDDPTTGVRCHWDRDSYESLCDEVLELMQDVWAAQVDGLDWPEPYPDEGLGGTDGVDFYMSHDGEYGAYTICEYDGWCLRDADPTDGRAGCAANVVIDPRGLNDDLAGFVAHEFNHVLQFAVDFNEPSLPPWEGAAVQAEEQTWAGTGSWKLYGKWYQDTPWAGLLNDG